MHDIGMVRDDNDEKWKKGEAEQKFSHSKTQ